MTTTKLDVVIFGATGFTGRLITQYLAAHPQRPSFSLGVAARSVAKLQSTVEELGLADSGIQLVTVDVANPESVEEAVKTARVIINTVGPFWKWGSAVVESCVRNRVHYVDLTGEGVWIKTIIDKYDWLASKNHTVIVPACGYDSVPSDISAFLANKTLKEYPGAQLAGLHTSISAHKVNTGISGGTISSVITALEEIPEDLQKLSMNPFFLSPMNGVPLPFPKLVYTLPVPGARDIIGGLWVMRSSNAAVVHRTAGLLELQARNARACLQPDPKLERGTYGEAFTYDEFMTAPSKISAFVTSLSIIFGLMLLKFVKPLRALVKAYIPSGSGPSEDQKDKGFLYLTNISTSVATPSLPTIKVKTEVIVKGDPGYYKTAVMISESALSLLLPPPSLPASQGYDPLAALPLMAREGGILTPMTAFGDVLIQRLRDTGDFEFSSQVVEVDDRVIEDRKRV